MSTAIKTGLIAVCGLVLLLPLALIGVGADVEGLTNQTCTVTPATVSPSTPAATPTPSTAGSTIPTRSPSPMCDGGDGLPDDHGGGGIPAGYLFPSNAQQAVAVGFALAQLGKPYVFGATGPNSYDCSGLVMKAWAAAGVNIPRTTQYQVATGVAVTSLSAIRPGDLIFIPGSDGTMAHPGHVGMYIGTDGAGRPWLVQAAHTGTRIHTSLVAGWSSKIAAVRRPLYHR